MQTPRPFSDRIALWIAHGFGTGCIPVAPGTFGTAAGFLWIWLLLLPRSLWIYLIGMAAGFFLAVWIGGRAERILGLKDPGSIVIDEIAALPLAFLPAVIGPNIGGIVQPFSRFWHADQILLPLLAFGLFRLFDVLKPLGIKQSQNLPHGWGLVIDDFLAALCAAALLGIFVMLR